MSDDVFRPQKRQITDDEVNSANQLEEMANMRKNIDDEVQNSNFTNNSQVKGNIPEAFKKAAMSSGNKQTPKIPDMRVVGSSKLEDLIARIGEKGNIVYEKVNLPSKGKFYDGENGPTDGVIHLRPMTGEEEEILATPRFVKKGQAINMIFNRCIREEFDSANFLTQDRTYILIYLRGISYTPEYDVQIKDPDSDQPFATTINLDELFVDYCPDNFDSSKLEDILPETEYHFSYHLATGKDEQTIQDRRDWKAKNFNTANQADDTLLFKTAHLLEEIEGLTDKTEIQILLKKLPIKDIAYLRTVVNEPPFGVNTKISVTNPYSLKDFEIELPLESNFFFPRAKRKTD